MTGRAEASRYTADINPCDVWVGISTGAYNVTDLAFDPNELTPVTRAILVGLLEAGIEAVTNLTREDTSL